jgi:PDZ domain-containing secreted protein
MNMDGILNNLIEVKYRVRLDSILGPILFIILVGYVAVSPGISDGENVVYSDDSNDSNGGNVSEVIVKLTDNVFF